MSPPLPRLTAALEGRYAIEGELGAGGMATVYLADDVKHERKVAIKVLRPELAAVIGAERFISEIKTTANLQHPHILPLFDSGEADGFLFYVMPHVDGESLRQLLDRERQLPLEQALDITTKVAAALQHAHDRGVVHRDIKPANILIQEGEPLVADFGIALAVSQAGGGRLTETGLSLGTPHYMSPEQATGDRDPDARSDIYSLGCVAYEMLAGEPPHDGKSAQAILTRLLTADVSPPSELRSSIPGHVDAAVLKALERLPADRFQDVREFSRALSDPTFTLPRATTTSGADTTQVTAQGQALERAGTDRRLRVHPVGLAAVLAIMAGTIAWAVSRAPAPPPTTRTVFTMPPGQEIVDQIAQGASFTPDGSALVYVGAGPDGPQLLVKDRSSHVARALPGTTGAESPETNPTGDWVAYIVGQELRKTPLVGGPSVVIGDSASSGIGSIAWLDDGTIAYGSTLGIRRVPQGGGASERLAFEELSLVFSLSALPGGHFLFVVCSSSDCLANSTLWVWDSAADSARVLEESVSGAWYLKSGHLVMVRPSGGVFGVPFDTEALSLEGSPTPLFDDVQIDQAIIPDMEVGLSGQLLVQLGAQGIQDQSFHWVDRSGARTAVDPDFSFRSVTFPAWRLSPDARRVAFAQTTDAGTGIWVKELDQGPVYRLTFDEGTSMRPEWYPDGESILFVNDLQGRDLHSRRANATGPVELVLDRPSEISQGTWSPDGEWLVYREGTDGGRDIWAFRPGQDSVPEPLIAVDGYDEKAATISPDGSWIAYESDETTQEEIYVRPFPNVEEGKWQISVGGGREPLWAHSGRELFYIRSDGDLMAAEIDAGPPFRVGARTVLFMIPDLVQPGEDHTSYDIHPDDDRFLFAIPEAAEDGVEPIWLMVDNWSTELIEQLGGGRR